MIKRKLLPHSLAAENVPLRMGKAKQSALDTEIRCLVWNIWKAKRRGWFEEFARLCRDTDLVVLQEAVSNAPSDAYFANNDNIEWMMARSYRHARTAIETGVKTGCIVASRSSRVYASPHAEPFANTRKMLLQTIYPLSNGGDLMVLNMHAINFVSNKKYVSHLDQLAGALGSHTGPVILAGDFNTWSLQRYGCFSEVAARAGLIEAQMQRRRKWAHMNKHLDHVFYRGLILRSVDSLDHVKLSDHAPITATFEQENR
ncbi:MAG: endonuclease/exonuclease/phosphatase family protein [Granulosicoccaceae bacterium]